MRTLNDVFTAWGTLTEMAAAIKKNRAMVEKWKERGRIPSEHWPSLIVALRAKGYEMTGDRLLAMHERRTRSAA